MVVVGGTLGVELGVVLKRELETLLVLSEEGLDGLDAGLIRKLLDSEELEGVSVVLKINPPRDSETKLEETVELQEELRLGIKLGLERLVVEENTSLMNDEEDKLVDVKEVDVVVVVVMMLLVVVTG